MCGLVVHQTDPYTPWGVGVLRYHRIPPLHPTSTDHSVLWACRTVDQGALPMDQPAITGRFSSRASPDTVPKPNEGGPGPHQFPPDVSGGEGVLKKIGLTCVLSAFLIGCASLVRELLSSQNIKGRLCER